MGIPNTSSSCHIYILSSLYMFLIKTTHGRFFPFLTWEKVEICVLVEQLKEQAWVLTATRSQLYP